MGIQLDDLLRGDFLFDDEVVSGHRESPVPPPSEPTRGVSAVMRQWWHRLLRGRPYLL